MIKLGELDTVYDFMANNPYGNYSLYERKVGLHNKILNQVIYEGQQLFGLSRIDFPASTHETSPNLVTTNNIIYG